MLCKIAGMWKKTKDDGTEYLKGRVEFPTPLIIEDGLEIVLLRSKKDHPNAPYYDLLIDKPRPKD